MHLRNVCLVIAVFCTSLLGAPQTADARSLPRGYELQCHNQVFESARHCHVVPVGSEPVFEPFGGWTMALQFFGGIAGAVVVGGGAGYGTYLLLDNQTSQGEETSITLGFIAGLLAAFPGMALGTWGVGSLAGGDGSYWWTLGGAFLLGVIGSIGGYHISADHVYEEQLDEFEHLGPGPPLSSQPAEVGVPLVVLRF